MNKQDKLRIQDKVAMQIADHYPPNVCKVLISHLSEEGMNLIAVVTLDTYDFVAVYKVHFDPNGTIMACDPDLPPKPEPHGGCEGCQSPELSPSG